MKHFLDSMMIYGREGGRRHLSFGPGVKIISGGGSKGKSTVLHILAYCLGATRCNIPVGRVRDFASWFLLKLNVGEIWVLLGRKAPSEGSQVSDEAFYREDGVEPELPQTLNSNCMINYACGRLGERLGLPRTEFRLQDESLYGDGALPGTRGHIEMRDLLPLLLQPQDVIATRRLFAFFGERASNVRTEMMKIALGIVSPTLLRLRADKDNLQKKKQAYQREEKEQKAAFAKAMGDLRSIWQQAIVAEVVPSISLDSLEQAQAEVEKLKKASITELEEVHAAVDHKLLLDLGDRSRVLRGELQQIRRELQHLAELKHLAEGANSSLKAERARMQVVDLLGVPIQSDVECPLCGSGIGGDTASSLAEMQTKLDAELSFTESIPPDLERQETTLKSERARRDKELRETERRLEELQKQELAPTFTQARVERERKIGALETVLRTMPAQPKPDPRLVLLDDELLRIEKKLGELPAEREEKQVKLALRSCMTNIAREFARMNLRDGFLLFDEKFSTIQRELEGRRDPLDILGGAEIHVMYHIAVFLGLHEYLSGPEIQSFVPRLLVLDQPSQAYFPSESDEKKTDTEAVQAIYDLIFRYCERLENRVQIIVLDHADFSKEDERFRRVREDWHGGEGLIKDDMSS